MPIRDTRMEARAAEQRWPISKKQRKILIEKNFAIISNPRSSAREVAASSRVIAALESQNIADEREDRMDEGRNRILDLLARARTGGSDQVIDARGKAIAVRCDDGDENKGQAEEEQQ